ncbi:MAG TPA: hypothetical protein VFX17_01385 [Patescibacteria group bacterium]|nr:hypothetical protein [Patescibacteria group bacterium]
MNENELGSQLKIYTELRKENKDINVAALALAALADHQSNLLTPKEKRIAYLISLSLPPFGALYALKFYTSGKSDGKTAAYMCLGLTVASILSLFLITGLMFKSSGLSTQQLEQAPQQYQDLLAP